MNLQGEVLKNQTSKKLYRVFFQSYLSWNVMIPNDNKDILHVNRNTYLLLPTDVN